MRSAGFDELIRKGTEHTKRVLFGPFILKKWVKLVFIAWLAGALSGTGPNLGGGSRGGAREGGGQQAGAYSLEVVAPAYARDESAAAPEGQRPDVREMLAGVWKKAKSANKGLVALGAVFFLAVLVVYTWLSSRFKFVWFNAVANNTDAVRIPFRDYAPGGNSLFKFYLILGLGQTVVLGLPLAVLAWRTFSGGPGMEGFSKLSLPEVFSLLWPAGLAAVLLAAFFAVLSIWIEHFAVPVMALDRCGFLEGWRRFRDVYARNRKDFWLYLLVMLGLKIVVGLMFMVLFFVLMLAVLLVGGLSYGLLYFLVSVVLKAKAVFTVLALLLGVVSFAAAAVFISALQLPFAVFFRSFSLYFLGSVPCGYNPLATDEGPAPQAVT